MAGKPTHKMTTADRAKQFAPFAALRGLPEALAAKERIVIAHPELSEEKLAELDESMQMLKCGEKASVIFYSKGECIQISGMVAKIETTSRILQIVNTRIPFDDILEVSVADVL